MALGHIQEGLEALGAIIKGALMEQCLSIAVSDVTHEKLRCLAFQIRQQLNIIVILDPIGALLLSLSETLLLLSGRSKLLNCIFPLKILSGF